MTVLPPRAGELLELAGGGHLRSATDLVLSLHDGGMGVPQLVDEVLAPAQRQVGLLWEARRWSVDDEHRASGVIDGVLGALSLQAVPAEPALGRVLVACAEGEHHTMPARMGVQVLRSEGWEVTFLGGSVAADDLQRHAAVGEPDAVLVSCTLHRCLPGAARAFAAIAALGLPAVAVGAAFGDTPTRALHLGAHGWLRPGGDLAALLDHGHAREVETWKAPPEALALELEADDLQRACRTTMAERLPQLATCSPAQRASITADVADVLSAAGTSIALDDVRIFTDHVDWRSRVLGAQGVPPSVLGRSLAVVGQVLREAGMGSAARLCALHRAIPTVA